MHLIYNTWNTSISYQHCIWYLVYYSREYSLIVFRDRKLVYHFKLFCNFIIWWGNSHRKWVYEEQKKKPFKERILYQTCFDVTYYISCSFVGQFPLYSQFIFDLSFSITLWYLLPLLYRLTQVFINKFSFPIDDIEIYENFSFPNKWTFFQISDYPLINWVLYLADRRSRLTKGEGLCASETVSSQLHVCKYKSKMCRPYCITCSCWLPIF